MKLGLPKAIVASLVLVAGTASACSGGNTASKDDFCDNYQAFTDSLTDIDSEDPKDYIKALKESAEEFGDGGVPDDMSDDAKAGFELILDAIDSLDDDSTLEDLGQMEEDFSEEEQKQSDAFEEYLDKTCPDVGFGGSE